MEDGAEMLNAFPRFITLNRPRSGDEAQTDIVTSASSHTYSTMVSALWEGKMSILAHASEQRKMCHLV